MRREVRIVGDPVLRTRAAEVEVFDRELALLAADLVETMHEAGGVGLAANQVGVLLRVAAFDVPDTLDHPGAAGVICNPRFELVSEEEELGEEGCLSIPEVVAALSRPVRVEAVGLDIHGEPLRVEARGLLARCLLHEVDHLDGVLFIDRLPLAERREVLRSLARRDLPPPSAAGPVRWSPH